MKANSGFGNVVGFLAILLLLLWVGQACESDESKEERLRERAAEPQIVVDGQNGVFIQQTLVSVSDEAYDTLSSYIIHNNTEAIADQMRRGEVFIGNKGEVVRVIDSGFMKSYIEVVET